MKTRKIFRRKSNNHRWSNYHVLWENSKLFVFLSTIIFLRMFFHRWAESLNIFGLFCSSEEFHCAERRADFTKNFCQSETVTAKSSKCLALSACWWVAHTWTSFSADRDWITSLIGIRCVSWDKGLDLFIFYSVGKWNLFVSSREKGRKSADRSVLNVLVFFLMSTLNKRGGHWKSSTMTKTNVDDSIRKNLLALIEKKWFVLIENDIDIICSLCVWWVWTDLIKREKSSFSNETDRFFFFLVFFSSFRILENDKERKTNRFTRRCSNKEEKDRRVSAFFFAFFIEENFGRARRIFEIRTTNEMIQIEFVRCTFSSVWLMRSPRSTFLSDRSASSLELSLKVDQRFGWLTAFPRFGAAVSYVTFFPYFLLRNQCKRFVQSDGRNSFRAEIRRNNDELLTDLRIGSFYFLVQKISIDSLFYSYENSAMKSVSGAV